MEVLTYCFMSNHFHIFVRLDPKETEHLDDAGLVERFRALYGSTKCASLGLDADDLEVILKNNRASAEGIRRRLKARMGDVSVFMREFKTRFTFWYNEKHGTVGTFWAERFRSVVVEADTEGAEDGGGLYRFESGAGRAGGGCRRLWFQRFWGGVRGWFGGAAALQCGRRLAGLQKREKPKRLRRKEDLVSGRL